MNRIRKQAVTNIFANMSLCWEWDNPTGSLLEKAITRACKAIYKNVRHLGSGATIVDVAVGKMALDIKGSGSLSILQKNTDSPDANYVKHLHNGKTVWIKIPKFIKTQIRRPTVDLENWQGDAEKILRAQIADYENFALSTTKEAGCDSLSSLVVLYGENAKLGIRAAYISLSPFSCVYPETYHAGTKCYYGLDANGNETFSIRPMNKGSVNTYKRFETAKGILKIWPISETTSKNFSSDFFGEDSLDIVV